MRCQEKAQQKRGAAKLQRRVVMNCGGDHCEPRHPGWQLGIKARKDARPTKLWVASFRFFGMHWDHEPRTYETIPPTCCRHLAGRGIGEMLCRQDAGSTLRLMENATTFLLCVLILFVAK